MNELNNLEKLIEDCKYNPLEIGIKILEAHDYKVKTFQYSDSIYVYESENQENLLYSNT